MIEEVEKLKPAWIPIKCPVCNGFGTLKFGELKCHGCDGTGYIKVPPENEKDAIKQF